MTGRLPLLTRHFLRRFLENDLISPGGDSHLGAGHALAAVFVGSLMVFVTVTLKYSLFRMTWTQVLDWSFDDAALYVAAPMILFGLAATMAWDAFYLDARDHAALAALPLAPRLLSAAKLAALCVFLIALTIAANLVPIVFAAPMMLRAVRGATLTQWAVLAQAHAAASLGAGLWTALAIVALRGVLGRVLPVRVLRRAGPLVQASLLFVFLGWLVLLHPFVRMALVAWNAGGWLRDDMPPFWFIAVHRALVGRLEPACEPLLRRAIIAFAVTLVAVVILYLLSPSRREYGQDAASVPSVRGRSGVRRPGDRQLRWLSSRSPVARAIFEFTLKGCWRNGVQRLYLAAAAGAGLAWAGGAVVSPLARPEGAPLLTVSPATLQVQLVLALFAASAVRLAVAMPVALNANWVFRATEQVDTAAYLVGARRAALVIAALPVMVLAPFHAWLWGVPVAAAHVLVGTCHAVCIVELLFLARTAIPFTTPHVSGSLRLKTRWPLYLFAPAVLAGAPAKVEHLLLEHGWLVLVLPAFLLAIAALLALERRRREHGHRTLVFDEPPLDAFQTLAIFE